MTKNTFLVYIQEKIHKCGPVVRQTATLLKYDTIKDKWCYVIKNFQNNSFPTNCSLALNNKTNTLYLQGCNGNSNFIKLNLKTNEYDIFKSTSNPNTLYQTQLVIFDNKIHAISGWRNNKHLTWNNSTLKYDAFHTFHEYDYGICDPTLIHFPNMKYVLLMGGYNVTGWDHYAVDTIYKYDYKNKSNQNWKRMKCKLPKPIGSCAYVLTCDEKYVILFGWSNQSIEAKRSAHWQSRIFETPTTDQCGREGM